MLKLTGITKDYVSGDNTVHALKDLSITLRDHEFVSILGPSGCGKTTTLNIIGGLDRYTSGDLVIDGRSTKSYNDRDWDTYRNHTVGFVFQSYNLIPHQTVLSNVELALTIGNVPKADRKQIAIEALRKVGLENEINKHPNQLSGGQMQRVAIARAIVNNPKVILADEPTGALDSTTSIQVLNILKELSSDCLVVMVTHNVKLADKYSTRIIKLNDGEKIDDSNPYIAEEENSIQAKPTKKSSMPFSTALKLSLSNMKSKIGRTLLTCFAGSIGIIGIALILSVSNGFNNYVSSVEQSTLSNYPVTISSSSVDVSALFTTFMTSNQNNNSEGPIDNKIVPNYVMVQLLETMAKSSKYNDLKSFKAYIEEHIDDIKDNILHISYGYDATINAYDTDKYDDDENFVVKQLEPFTLPDDDAIYVYDRDMYDKDYMESFMRRISVWSELFDDTSILESQYDLLSGSWPDEYDEVVYVVDSSNEISDYALYATGMIDNGDDYVVQLFNYVNNPDDYEDPRTIYDYEFTYADLMANEFYIVPEALYYQQTSTTAGGIPIFTDISSNDDEMAALLQSTDSGVIKLKVSGIVRENPDSDTHSIDGTIGYTSALTQAIIAANNSSPVVEAQEANPDYCLINYQGYPSAGLTWSQIRAYLSSFGTSESVIEMFSDENALSTMLSLFGYVDLSEPSYISIYPKSFEDKDAIVSFIDTYNSQVEEAKQISYTDYVAQIMGSVSTIINAITYVLIAFVSISLVVSSIMIAIITYISVLERTKEIGVLRAMGASKQDVKNIFNAETFLTGLISGVLGIVITLILNIPINIIIDHLANIGNIAVLPWQGGLILIAVSFFLSVISGLIPSSYAAKCDPVVALRTE